MSANTLQPTPGDFSHGAPGLSLNFVDCDVLADYPGVYTVVRMRYFNGNRYEIAVCRDCVDQDDLNASLSLIPQPIRLVGYEVDTETLCCGPEITYMYWETNAEATMKALSFTP